MKMIALAYGFPRQRGFMHLVWRGACQVSRKTLRLHLANRQAQVTGFGGVAYSWLGLTPASQSGTLQESLLRL